jgi:hypothetical protein
MSTQPSTSGSTGTPPNPIVINTQHLTADGIKATETARRRAAVEGKRPVGRPRTKASDALQAEAVKNVLRASGSTTATTVLPPTRASPHVTREMKEFAARGMMADPRILQRGSITPEEKETHYYTHKIYQYYKHFPEKLGKPPAKVLDPGTGPDALASQRQHFLLIQSTMNSGFGDTATQLGLSLTATAIEFGYMMFCYNQPWNPMAGASLQNFAKVIKRDIKEFDDELTELKILYSEWFEQGVWVRLLSKLAGKAKEVVENNATENVRRNAPIDPGVAQKYADL